MNSAILVGGIDDLITEILLRLPAKSVAKFKLVSKRWLSVISDPNFIIRHSRRNSNSVPGLFMEYFVKSKPVRSIYVSFDENEESTATPTNYVPSDPDAPCVIRASRYCNGLVLCYAGGYEKHDECKFYVFNPTTHQSTVLPSPPVYDMRPFKFSLVLAHDPSKSPHYQVFGVQFVQELSSSPILMSCYILMYSSQTGVWEISPNHILDSLWLFNGFFLDGAIYWVSLDVDDGIWHSYCFDLDKKCLLKLPDPPLPEVWTINCFKYFGESLGCLYYISFDSPRSSKFIVHEMHKDRSGWFVKYSLDVNDIVAAFPEIVDHTSPQEIDFSVEVESLVEVKNKGPNLVMYPRAKPGKIISYCFKDNTFKKLHDHDYPFQILKWNAIKYFENLSSI